MTAKWRQGRYRALQELGCIACRKKGLGYSMPDIHHLNAGGHAGQKRLGDRSTIPLCPYHHRGIFGRAETYGPSLAVDSRKFREEFGTDEELLAEVNELIGDKP